MEKQRLNKFLAECGVCSRREADRLIEEGRVEVNGRKAVTGQQTGPEDRVEVNGRLLKGKETKAVLAYYKPAGIVCTEKDKFADKKITDVLKYKTRVTYAGRLDKDSEGLMIMTNDGILIERMMRGANGHEKYYLVKVKKEVADNFLKGMADGVFLEELHVTTRPCRVEKLGKFTFGITLTQGLNRQIRRMCQKFGYEVMSLKRVRILNIELNGLKPGEYRSVEGQELAELYERCGMRRPEE